MSIPTVFSGEASVQRSLAVQTPQIALVAPTTSNLADVTATTAATMYAGVTYTTLVLSATGGLGTTASEVLKAGWGCGGKDLLEGVGSLLKSSNLLNKLEMDICVFALLEEVIELGVWSIFAAACSWNDSFEVGRLERVGMFDTRNCEDIEPPGRRDLSRWSSGDLGTPCRVRPRTEFIRCNSTIDAVDIIVPDPSVATRLGRGCLGGLFKLCYRPTASSGWELLAVDIVVRGGNSKTDKVWCLFTTDAAWPCKARLLGTSLSGGTTWLMTLLTYGDTCGVDTIATLKFVNTVSQVALDGEYEIHDFGIKKTNVGAPESYTVCYCPGYDSDSTNGICHSSSDTDFIQLVGTLILIQATILDNPTDANVVAVYPTL
ncbi:hypothetical protein FOZ63_032791, partial [Perkinsus olseni]